MADIYTVEKRSQIMARVKNKNTKPEKQVRSFLHSLGYRFRIHVKDLLGKPDIVFTRKKKVIFVHGCFWHGHEKCKRATIPKTNTLFWETKISKNKLRDLSSVTELISKGWQVLIIWQCQAANFEYLQQVLTNFLSN